MLMTFIGMETPGKAAQTLAESTETLSRAGKSMPKRPFMYTSSTERIFLFESKKEWSRFQVTFVAGHEEEAYTLLESISMFIARITPFEVGLQLPSSNDSFEIDLR